MTIAVLATARSCWRPGGALGGDRPGRPAWSSPRSRPDHQGGGRPRPARRRPRGRERLRLSRPATRRSLSPIWRSGWCSSRAAPLPGGSRSCSGGLALAVAIGLSRVYLRVHYLSDVGGGWAVGLAVFSLCGAVALVRSLSAQQLRHAQPTPPPGGPPGGGRRTRGQPHRHLHHPGCAGVVGFSCFAVLILAPAWTAYGRTWERLAAAFAEHLRAGRVRRRPASASGSSSSTTGTRSWSSRHRDDLQCRSTASPPRPRTTLLRLGANGRSTHRNPCKAGRRPLGAGARRARRGGRVRRRPARDGAPRRRRRSAPAWR